MSQALHASGNATSARDLESVAETLTYFDEMTVGEWANFLRQAWEYHRTGSIPAAKTYSRATSRRLALADLEHEIEELQRYQARVADPNFDRAHLETYLEALGKRVNREDLIALAARMGLPRYKTKKDALEALKRYFFEQRASLERSQLIRGT